MFYPVAVHRNGTEYFVMGKIQNPTSPSPAALNLKLTAEHAFRSFEAPENAQKRE
jgi:hypothetical protein